MKDAPKSGKTPLKILHYSALTIALLITALLILILVLPDREAIRGIRRAPALQLLAVLDILLAGLIILTAVLSRGRAHEGEDHSAEDLKKIVNRDDLTNVYNRRALMKYLATIDPGSEYTVLLMNVDKFKDINEIYGYHFGDHVLQVIAKELVNYMKAYEGFVARYGSDEFLIIFRGVKLSEDSDAITHMRDIIHEPIRIGLANVIPTVCIGAAYSDGSSSAAEIVNHAEIAERAAKRRGRKSFMMFSGEMQNQMAENLDVKRKIRDAIANDGFYMVYQPQVRASDKKLVGYEGLIRMKKYSILPDVFIPIAEENGWLREIGRITTEKMIAQIAEWRRIDPDYHLPVSINFSSIQIRDTDYFYFLLDTLVRYEVPSNLVEIEITERIMLEYTKDTIELMNRFHAAGVRLAMDDFGTGYSSLSYLTQFPLDVIKIDKSFLSSNIHDTRRRKLIQDMIKLGHDLNTKIVVEGVENEQQYEYVKEMEADIIQGYYFSPPLAPAEAIRFQAG